jgi:hypothetical protein
MKIWRGKKLNELMNESMTRLFIEQPGYTGSVKYCGSESHKQTIN